MFPNRTAPASRTASGGTAQPTPAAPAHPRVREIARAEARRLRGRRPTPATEAWREVTRGRWAAGIERGRDRRRCYGHDGLSRNGGTRRRGTWTATGGGTRRGTSERRASIRRWRSSTWTGGRGGDVAGAGSAGPDPFGVRGLRGAAGGSGTSPARFTDDPLMPGVTPVLAVHLLELRARIDGLRSRAGLPAFAWTDPKVVPRGDARPGAAHLTELRSAASTPKVILPARRRVGPRAARSQGWGADRCGCRLLRVRGAASRRSDYLDGDGRGGISGGGT